MEDMKNTIEQEVEEVVEVKKSAAKTKQKAKTTTKAKKKTPREINNELRRVRKEVEFEILNISSGRCSYLVDNRYLFGLEVGQRKVLSLDELETICYNSKNFFANYDLLITDTYNDDYSIEDARLYLDINDFYEGIEDCECDFLEDLILNCSDEEFEKKIENKNDIFLQALTSKLSYLHSKGKGNLWGKNHILKTKLDLETLLD